MLLYTGAITDRSTGRFTISLFRWVLMQACYERFSTVDGVALFATTLDNDYSLRCDQFGFVDEYILPGSLPPPGC